MSRRTVDITGRRRGRLVAVRPLPYRIRGYVAWEWRCDCGAVVVRKQGIISDRTKSCGCISRELEDDTLRRFGHAIIAYKSGEGSLRAVAACYGVNFRKLWEQLAKDRVRQ